MPEVEKPQGISKRKLINKVHKKNKRRMERLANAYDQTTSGKSSGLGNFMTEDRPEMDFDMANIISNGHGRKMKKKMKKLKEKFGSEDQDKIFREMQKYKQTVIKTQEKTLFNPVSLMDKRREKRMKRMEANIKNMRREVIHKNQKPQ